MNSENKNKVGLASAEDEIVSADVAGAGEASDKEEQEAAEKTGSEHRQALENRTRLFPGVGLLHCEWEPKRMWRKTESMS